MAFATLKHVTNSYSSHRRLLHFEIRLSSDFIVFRGQLDETPSTKVQGHVVIMTSEPIQTKGIRIVLEGKRRTQHILWTEEERRTGPPVTGPIVNKTRFFRKECRLLAYENGPEIKTIQPGNHEMPFEIVLDGNVPESIEGLGPNFISYDLRAVADRGMLAKDLVATKHVRVIRTLSEETQEMIDSQDVSGTWPDKIKYQFMMSSKSAIFGTSLIPEFQLTPLLEKLRIGKITVTVKEIRRIKTDPGPEYGSNGWKGMWREEEDVVVHKMEVPAGSEGIDTDTQLPNVCFQAAVPLPKSLSKCRQDVERNEWVQIKHHVHYDIILRNPDGHLSQLKANHPIKLFISPNLPFDAQNNVATSNANGSIDAATLLGDMQAAPPLYETHRLDRLYEDVEHPSGYATPGNWSGIATPRHGFSRDASTENLVALQEAAHHSGNHVLAAQLHSRLEGLQEGREYSSFRSSNGNLASSPDHQPRRTSEYFNHSPNGMTESHSGDRHNAGSPNEASHNDEYDMNKLKKITSYETAVKSQVRTPFSELPPTYDTASSRPPSPGQHH